MSEKENEQIGALTGIAAGALAGATLGSAIIPVVGTFAGALAGGIMGSQVGKNIGGAILNSFEASTQPHPAKPTTEEMVAQLERLGQLRTQGVITEEEFAAAKAKILGG